MDRAINPHDGSRRRLKSAAHKSLKDYDRRINKQIKEEDTMESIEEGNRLIAEFLGYKVQTEDEFNSLADDDPETNIVVLEWLDYHKNWNRLMPVIKHIRSTEIFNSVDVIPPDFGDDEMIKGLLTQDIELVYSGVVKYIKWYNTKK